MAFIKCHEISYEKHMEIVLNKLMVKAIKKFATIMDCSKKSAFAVCKKFLDFIMVKICQGFVDQ